MLYRFARLPVLLTVLVAGTAAPASAGPYLLVEADSGRVIAQSDAGKPWYPASVTKLMTTYLTFRAMRERRVGSSTLLTVSELAVAQPPTKMGFKAGTQVTVDNAVKMLMVRSANDIAVVLAEGIGGSFDRFIEEMNATAARLGMSGTKFVNPHGLPDEGQISTARDMAILARALMDEFPEYEMYFRIPAIQIGKRTLRNHNKLIDHYPGADGMKTGFICSSGFNVVATARQGDRRLIAVVFGSPSGHQRAEEAARLFERGFSKRVAQASVSDFEIPVLEAIRNADGKPTDMREDMCSRKRKRPAAESDIDEEDFEETADANGKAKGKQTLLVDLPPSMPPLKVFVGAAPEPESADKPAKSEKAKTAAKPAASTASAKSDGKEPAAAKTAKPATAAVPAKTETKDSATKTAKPATAAAPAKSETKDSAPKTAKPAADKATVPAKTETKPATTAPKPATAAVKTSTADPKAPAAAAKQ